MKVTHMFPSPRTPSFRHQVFYFHFMKVLSYLQKAWLIAGVCAFVVAVYNLIALRVFNNHVYFPLFCAMFCFLIWFNIRGQRKFREKMFSGEGQEQEK